MAIQTLAPPVVASITAGVLIVGQMGLMFAAAMQRRRGRQAIGEGSDPAVIRAVRRHGNYAENAAIFVVVLALLEMMGAGRGFLAVGAAVFVAGRIAHAIGLSLPNTVNPLRIAGVFATIAAGLTLGLQLVEVGVQQLR
jgi:hypothetical protein